MPYSELVKLAEDILRRKDCALPGQTARAFDINVPYALLVDPDGTVKRLLVSDIGCAPLEALVGATVLARISRSDFLATGEAAPRWFGNRINFTQQ